MSFVHSGQFGSPLVELHESGAIVLVLQAVARLPEGRELVPAGLQTARPGHAMALARHPYMVVHRLQNRTKM